MTYGEPSRGAHPWSLPEDQAFPFLKSALDLGINFFDTANVYSSGSSEEILGNLIGKLAKREEVVIATKLNGRMRPDVNGAGLSRKAVFQEIDASLKRLKMDYVDLYQIHRWDYETPIEETLEALTDVVKSGKVRYIGASSMFAWQFSKALYLSDLHGWARFVTMQNHYNLLYREEEREMMGLCSDQKIGVIPWSPLARGKLTRDWEAKTDRSESDEFGKTLYRANEEAHRTIVQRVAELASKHGVNRAQVALAWVLAKSPVSAPIIGASKPGHLEDAVAAVNLKLSPDELKYLEDPYLPQATAGFS